MDEANDTCPVAQPSSSAAPAELIDKFWDLYVHKGIGVAATFFHEEVENNIVVMQTVIPALVAEGYRRELNMMEFLQKMQTEDDDANSNADDAGGIPPVSDNEDDNPEDEDESAEEYKEDDLYNVKPSITNIVIIG